MKQSVKEEWKVEGGLYRCPHCEQLKTKKQLASHLWLSHTEEGRAHRSKVNVGLKGRKAWNKGLTKETDERVAKYGSVRVDRVKQGLVSTNKGKKIKHNPEWIKTLSEKQSLCNTGGKSKWYEVAGQKVQGTWEKALAEKLEELGIRWQKIKTNTEVIEYRDQTGKIRRYTPDFFLEDYSKILEVKGYWWGTDKDKMSRVLDQNKDLQGKLLILEKVKFKKLLEVKTKVQFETVLGTLAEMD